MEATYCIGSDTDFSRMFDQYLYKVRRNELIYCQYLTLYRRPERKMMSEN